MTQEPVSTISNRKILPCLLLCLLFGWFGTHRFYVGKSQSGILQMLTLGGLGFWVIWDAIMIVMRKFKDADGACLTQWT